MTRHKYLVLCEPIKWVLHTVHRLVVSMKLSVCVCVWRKLLIFHILVNALHNILELAVFMHVMLWPLLYTIHVSMSHVLIYRVLRVFVPEYYVYW